MRQDGPTWNILRYRDMEIRNQVRREAGGRGGDPFSIKNRHQALGILMWISEL